jgi:hypothetical protein
MSKKKVFDKCRVCGESKPLTEEHFIPRAAGGGVRHMLYGGDELLKSLKESGYRPRGKYKQNGLTSYTLCKECNDFSGLWYDKDFAYFYNGVNNTFKSSLVIPEDQSVEDYLSGKAVDMILYDIKPFNVAKRILVSFCSVEYPGLTDRKSEIRRAILDRHYVPNTDDFAIYMSLHVGNNAYYATMGVLKHVNNKYFSEAYAGLENEFIAFYFSSDKETKARGLENCIDITSWLTRYAYDQEAAIKLKAKFNRSLNVNFPGVVVDRKC